MHDPTSPPDDRDKPDTSSTESERTDDGPTGSAPINRADASDSSSTSTPVEADPIVESAPGDEQHRDDLGSADASATAVENVDDTSGERSESSEEKPSASTAGVTDSPPNEAPSQEDEGKAEPASEESPDSKPVESSSDDPTTPVAVGESTESGPKATTIRDESAASKPAPVWYMEEPRDRPLPWLSWWYSLIFVVAVIGVIATIAYEYVTQADDSPQELIFRVVNASQTPIPGATITLGTTIQTTDADGTAHLPQGTGIQPIKVEREGYIAVEGTVDPADGERREITLEGAPSPTPAPAGTPASPAANAPDATPATADATASAILDLPVNGSSQGLSARELAGKVLDANGAPIQGARINAGAVWSVTGADGIYILRRAAIDIHQPIHVFAPGYVDAEITVPPLGNVRDITLQVRTIKAIYLNPTVTNTQDEIDGLIAIANTTEINAIVIDIKEEQVFYDSQVPLFRSSGTINPLLDLPDLLDQLHANGIYTIARLVVFKDSIVAEQHPDLAIRSTETGDVWRDQNGVAWVNPMKRDLWEANTALAVEAANLGFDEIQFDYVRFPTDGDLSTMDFGAANNETNREQTITGFVDFAWQQLIPTGAKLSADIFGYTLMVQDDIGIGQNLSLLAPHLDYLSPMVYPSHYGKSFQGYSPPADYPAEVVGITLQTGLSNHAVAPKKLRPWLQDFDYSANDKPYGAPEVRAQIDAAEAAGSSGWMLWTLGNPITVDALKPESGRNHRSAPVRIALIALGNAAYDPFRTFRLI